VNPALCGPPEATWFGLGIGLLLIGGFLLLRKTRLVARYEETRLSIFEGQDVHPEDRPGEMEVRP